MKNSSLMSKFLRLLIPGVGLFLLSASTLNAATIYVAASNSSASDKAAATYVTAGDATDRTTIATADTAAGADGTIKFFDGTYKISIPNNGSLGGVLPSSNRIYVANTISSPPGVKFP